MSKLRLAVAGAGGRMGRQLIQAIAQNDDVVLGAAFEREGSSLTGTDAGELAGIGRNGVLLTADLNSEKDNFDILIDFTRPEGTLTHLAYCTANGKGMISVPPVLMTPEKPPLHRPHNTFLWFLRRISVLASIWC